MTTEKSETIEDLFKNLIDRTIEVVTKKNPGTFSEVKPSDLFCEGWLTSILLEYWERSDLKLDFLPGKNGKTKWAREVSLRNPFCGIDKKIKEKKSPKEKFNVGLTQADAVVGHFGFRKKRGLELDKEATQFIVLESKINAGLDKTTKNWKDETKLDQATRNVMAMAYEIQMAKEKKERDVNPEEYLGQLTVNFIVISPEARVKKHKKFLDKERMLKKQHMLNVTKEMIKEISKARSQEDEDLKTWQTDYFKPLVEKIKPRCVTWENIIDQIKKQDDGFATLFEKFYDHCK